jgi:hypothetical protein
MIKSCKEDRCCFPLRKTPCSEKEDTEALRSNWIWLQASKGPAACHISQERRMSGRLMESCRAVMQYDAHQLWNWLGSHRHQKIMWLNVSHWECSVARWEVILPLDWEEDTTFGRESKTLPFKCGLISIGSARELVRNVGSLAPARPNESESTF